MTPRQWTMPDIAAHLGVDPATVRSWLHRARRAGFPSGQMPEPTGRVQRSPWWAPDDIEPWLRQWEIDHEPYEGSGSE